MSSSNRLATDDAFIAARQFAIAPKVSGYITAVPVTDNQHVSAGDTIGRIDDRDYRIALDQAQAQVANAEAVMLIVIVANDVGDQVVLATAVAELSLPGQAGGRLLHVSTDGKGTPAEIHRGRGRREGKSDWR
jgi:membrane fusion protein (multidrug efflux system)